MKHIFILLIAVTAINACTGKKINEKEPNNTYAQANEINPGESMHGLIDTEKDIDFYKIKIEEESILDIKISPIKGVNSSLKFWSTSEGSPRVLKYIDDTRKSSPEQVHNLYVTPGIYLVSVQHGIKDKRKANSETPYTLNISSRRPSDEETEPNDSMDTADSLQLNQELTAFYSPGYNRLNNSKKAHFVEEDWFTFELDSDEPELVNISVSAVNGMNPRIYLYDQELNQVTYSDKSGKNSSETISDLGLSKSGKYYIVVSTSTYSSSEKPYTIVVNKKTIDPSAEVEINNNFATANVIQENNIKAKINSVKDIDFFKYENPGENKFHRIEVNTTKNIDTILHIYDKDQNILYTINNNVKSEPEIFPNFYQAGPFYLAVTSKSTILQPDLDYKITIHPLAEEENRDLEPNDTLKQATLVKEKNITGYISHKKDKDYYKFLFDKRVKLTFDIEGVENGAIKVSVTDPLGYSIKDVEITGKETITVSEMIDKQGYLIIEAQKADYNNPYTITIR